MTSFNFKFSRLFSKNKHPGKHPCTYFLAKKVSSLISVERRKALSRSLNDKNIRFLTFDNLFLSLLHSP